MTDVFTETEAKPLISALLEGEGRGVSAGEVAAFFQWAEKVRVEAAIVELLVKGKLVASWSPKDDDWAFKTRKRDDA